MAQMIFKVQDRFKPNYAMDLEYRTVRGLRNRLLDIRRENRNVRYLVYREGNTWYIHPDLSEEEATPGFQMVLHQDDRTAAMIVNTTAGRQYVLRRTKTRKYISGRRGQGFCPWCLAWSEATGATVGVRDSGCCTTCGHVITLGEIPCMRSGARVQINPRARA